MQQQQLVTKTSILLWMVPIALSVAHQSSFSADNGAFFPFLIGALAVVLFIYAFAFFQSRPILHTRVELAKMPKMVPYSLASNPTEELALTKQLPVESTPKAIRTMAGLALQAIATTLANSLGLRAQIPRPLSLKAMPNAIPTTKLAQAALQLCQKTLPEFAVQHSLRTYWFGVAVADQLGVCYDAETFFVAAILHDLSWDLQFDVSKMDFEVSGAQRALQFCQQHDVPTLKAHVIHEMVALHTSPALQHAMPSKELAMVHYGAGVDVAGFYKEEVHTDTLRHVVQAHPRLDFKNQCCGVMQEICRQNPTSHMAQGCRLGFLQMVRAGPFDE